jgi:hypothetical protein
MENHVCSWSFCAHCDYFIVFAKLTLAGFSTFVGLAAGWILTKIREDTRLNFQERLGQSLIILMTTYLLMLRFQGVI